MKRMHALAATGLAAALVVACAGARAEDGPAPAGPGPRRAPVERAGPGAPREEDPAVDAWARSLAERLADGNPAIRRSAHAGLAALGPAALPELGRLAGSEDRAVADAAMNLIAAIKSGGPGRAGRGGRDGFGPGRRGPGARGPGARGPGAREGRGPGPRDGFGPGPGPGSGGPDRGPGNGPREGFGGPDRGEGRGPGFGPGGPGGPGMGGPGRGGPGGPRGPGAMLERLDLTPEQRSKVDALHEAAREKMEALGAKVRAGELEPDAAREAHEKIRAENREALRGILTPEQFEKLPEPPTPGAAPRGR